MPFSWCITVKNIRECAEFYKSLLKKDYFFTLENGVTFKLFFKANGFYHLTGLHKLSDVRQLSTKGASTSKIYKDILTEKISVKSIESSAFYSKISNRIRYFEYIADMFDKEKSKIIIDFNPDLLGKTELKNTKYILFRHLNSGYLNLTLGETQKSVYPETLFYENSKRYISEQTLLDILNIEIVKI